MPQPDLTLTPAGPALAPRYRDRASHALPRHREPHTLPHPRDTPHAPPGKPSPPANPYLRLFAHPGTRAFTAGNLIARLPMGMFGVSAVIMIAAAYGSYALAGAVTATGLAVGSVTGPLIARLVDRYGQARIAVPAAAYAALGHLVLLLCVHARTPVWALFLTTAVTATTPNTGGMSRARWAHLFRDDPHALHTANAFEQAADELCYMLGPVLAAVLCSALFPEAGTLTAAALFLGGVLVFTAQRSTEPPIAPRTTAGSPLRAPGMAPLLAVLLTTGAVFGSMEVVALAYVDGPVAGPVLALQAAGSCAAGLLYGRAHRTARLRTCLAAMAVLMAMPLLAASTGSLLALAGGLLLAGMATAPTMVTAMGLLQRLTPAAQLNEGMSLAVTALLAGVAAGSATGGWAADHAPFASFGFLIPVTAATAALILCAATGVGRGPRVRA
ncbi:MFS transporter [Streptomyces tanashiensis]|uniref:MFS transporter n=1 Tax=Streptomyces tanashiensis TaxID=67367 RepID=UPI00167D2337|nr:MFS transporter [Streptomyces tanashiensis]GGY51408.1 transporter [Streptomyces tanashiensis]